MPNRNKVMVFGDAILDSYLFGETSCISPEAPVPILSAVGREHRLGGAANVAANAAALGAEVCCVFAIADDADAEVLKKQLSDYAVDLSKSVVLSGGRTIVKERVMAGSQQIVRIDYNDSVNLDETESVKLEEAIADCMKNMDVAIISDYGKGTCSERLCTFLIACAQGANVPVIVDPKGREWAKYHGATVITPNLKEINAYTGKSVANDDGEIEVAYAAMPKELGISNVLLTRSEHGMSLIDNEGIVSIEARRHEVFDVSGAGDTVVAALACELMPGFSNMYHAVSIANVAAGVAVGKRGTAIVTRAELERELAGNISIAEEKIFGLKDRDCLAATIESWRRNDLKIVATSGCFDIIHRGHMYLFACAAELGDRLVVLMNSDASVRRLKGSRRPVNAEADRAFVLASLTNVDAVVVFDPALDSNLICEDDVAGLTQEQRNVAVESPIGMVKMIRPDVYVKGGDYLREQVPEAFFAGTFKSASFLNGYSTTGVVDKCQ